MSAASRHAWTKSRTAGLRSPRRQAIASRAGSRPLTGMQTIPPPASRCRRCPRPAALSPRPMTRSRISRRRSSPRRPPVRRPARALTASQKSRCEPAEAGSAATGSLMISENSTGLAVCQRVAGADRDEPPFGGEYDGLDLGGVNGQPHERGVGGAVPQARCRSPHPWVWRSTCQPGCRLANWSVIAGYSARPMEVSVPTRSTRASWAAASPATATPSSQSDGAQVQLDELTFTAREMGPAESHAGGNRSCPRRRSPSSAPPCKRSSRTRH